MGNRFPRMSRFVRSGFGECSGGLIPPIVSHSMDLEARKETHTNDDNLDTESSVEETSRPAIGARVLGVESYFDPRLLSHLSIPRCQRRP